MLRTIQESLFCNLKRVLVTPYTIYSASAGSGKTSTLVKEYLKVLLSSANPRKFRQMLAITFTNKAVNEMKGRILKNLYEFSRAGTSDQPSHMFRDICRELEMEPRELKGKAGILLKEILHNYAFFDISTIDKFTHRLIRTFARDLKLPQNFEVVLDTELLLEEAVARLLARAGDNPALTGVLIAFALEKLDDDKSWDIEYDLGKIGKLLFDETHAYHIDKLQDKGLPHFSALKEQLRQQIKASEHAMRKIGEEVLGAMASHDLERGDFTRGYFPDFMAQFRDGEFHKINFDAGWKNQFDETVPYNKGCAESTKATIDRLLPQWRDSFQHLKKYYYLRALLQNAYGNLVPLTTLNAIHRELTALEKERDLLPISSFNRLISNEIKDQPAPFIYERLGEKYRHYFIDEFQDTSEMQWQNLIPLIASALEGTDSQGKPGSLLLVGDAKQAIYRWRGGKAEQFLNLINRVAAPFTIAPFVEIKPNNYRSLPEIVRFNNSFFTFISASMNDSPYRDLYAEGSSQNPVKESGGYVRIQFTDREEMTADEGYQLAVYQAILEVCSAGYNHGDMCILTRTREQGVILADYLLTQGIPIISSESLLLKNHPAVGFLIALLKICHLPSDKEAAFELLYFLAGEGDRHSRINPNLDDPRSFLRQEYGFDAGFVRHATAYDGLEYAIRCFNLCPVSDAFITCLLDEAMAVEQKEDASIAAFLEYWGQKQDKLSITIPDGRDAIRIMTIHKAKGLEFPVVLYPYANTDIYNSRKQGSSFIWFPVDPGENQGFQELLLSAKSEMTSYGPLAASLYEEERKKLQLDAHNLLYVALTRAEEALYIFTERNYDARGEIKQGAFSGLFMNYLQQLGLLDKHTMEYSFGRLPEAVPEKKVPANHGIPFRYSYKTRPAFRLLTRAAMLWDSPRGEAIVRGTLIHELMSRITTAEDIQPALETLRRRGALTEDETGKLQLLARAITTHEELIAYYSPGAVVENESELITGDGLIVRPDRIVFFGNKAILIDYKTGVRDLRYAAQLNAYAHTLAEMGYQVEKKIIVYINEGVTPEYI